MGNCGSKSIIIIVKEQRVNSSLQKLCLRRTLMGFERNYQIKVLSKQIKKYYTTLATPQSKVTSFPGSLNSFFITGFTDAEGCFQVQINSSKTTKIRLTVQVKFLICIDQKDKIILEKIKSYFGVGNI